jgi:cytochrome c biogenesis protein
LSAKDRNAATVLWDFFCSLKLTITTLILLAATSIIGTVIQQGRSPQEYLQQYSESTYRLFETLGFFDMYHSWWFLSLLGLFSINLIACSIKRFPVVWKTVRNPVLVADDTLFRTLSNMEEHLVKEPVAEVQGRLSAYVGQHFATPVVTEKDGAVHLYAQKGAWARFGVYVTHASILIIFIGAIVGSLWGYKAYVNIVEGTETTQVYPRGSSEPIDLGFTVRCDAFSVSYYEGTTRPREFKSLLTVIDSGQVIKDKRPIIVNDPLTYKGITFYQSSYGPAGDPTFNFQVKVRATGEIVDMAVRQGQRVALPGGGSFRVADFTDQFQNFGAAARLEVSPPAGTPRSFVVLQAFPEFDVQRGGDYAFTLVDYQRRFYTGLQVAKDPGVWIVWLGCALMVVGSLVAFFLSHRRLWITIRPVGDKTGIKVGGSAHRNQPAFEIFFDEFKKNLKAEISAKS